MNKNLEHCSLSKVKQFVSGLILGENRKSSEKHIGKMSEKCQKRSKSGGKDSNQVEIYQFSDGWLCVEKWYGSKNSENRLERVSLHSKMDGKEKFVKSFGIMRDQKRRIGNYGEPSGNICSDLLIEPQVTSLGHDLKWPHDEHTHSADCTWTYHDQNWTKNAQTVHHGPSPTGQHLFTTEDLPLLYLNYYRLIQPRWYYLPRSTSPLWTIWTQFSDEKVTHLPLPPTQSALIIFLVTRP